MQKSSKLVSIPQAIIEVGGYKTTTDQDGRFTIKFVSKATNNIPIIVQTENTRTIERFSFDGDFEKKDVQIIIK